jgi:hypothetical protein
MAQQANSEARLPRTPAPGAAAAQGRAAVPVMSLPHGHGGVIVSHNVSMAKTAPTSVREGPQGSES